MKHDLQISRDRAVLIAGPTASGKSGLAMKIAERHDRLIVNADAIQVFENWRVLTARPSPEDEKAVPHRLYGHVAADGAYSVGHWLRDLKPLLQDPGRLIIVGGTGLYFSALTEGLAAIPQIPPETRQEADDYLRTHGHVAMADQLDPATRLRIDTLNPARVQRAWEVLRATGRGLAAWQDDTPPPLLPPAECATLLVTAPKEWLNRRIESRFGKMVASGALDEARANLPAWDPDRLSSRAIGAPQLVAHLRGEITLQEACDAAATATRQFAKRQRNWFRSRMSGWRRIAADEL